MRLGYFLKIARPANILTAISDIIAGFAIAGVLAPEIITTQYEQAVMLLIATIGLYAGGIVFNDIFDFESDTLHRPERVLPMGHISVKEAVVYGVSLFVIAIISAFLLSVYSGIVSVIICLLALSYDKYAKHHRVLGPLNMGLCRTFNLFLGMSIVPNTIQEVWFIGFIPLMFIAAITLVAQKEAKGNNKSSIVKAIILDGLVTSFFIVLMFKGYIDSLVSFPFLLFWFGINLFAKLNAVKKNYPKQIKQAVKIGVLSLIPLNAIYVAGFSDGYNAILLIGLLPLSIIIAKYYAVT